MHRTATTCLTLAFAALTAIPIAAAPASAATAAAKPPNVRACFDGKCKITITKAVRFRISSRYGFTRLSIARVGSGMVKVRGTGPGVSSTVVLGSGGRGTINNLSVRVSSVTQKSATIRLAPR
ncbi:hypothetical protein ACQP2T_49510 [Nonomuraea sp. CA-143628]|uniref:hypothetical protein n=1 Tax=Nonomuraea sp. CA-143628 TaxID=3239997 RepID=UPI003D8A814E